MRVRIICKDDVNSWILGKFALKMQECLTQLGIPSDIGWDPDPEADINHNVVYNEFDGVHRGIDTMMITHIDDREKLQFLKDNIGASSMGICMSRQNMEWLSGMGVDKAKLCYVTPAHDGCALIKKIVVGIASRVYDDGRKKEVYFDKFAEDLNPALFHFKFMGAGWDPQVEHLKRKGFEVTYYNSFLREEYYKMIQSLDYYLYTGSDEGQMGFVDAAAAGVPTIVTPQGYHLDAPEALTYPFETYSELRDILLGFQKEKEERIDSVSDWTWMDYTKKHVEIWEYLKGNKVKSNYTDGLNSYFELQSKTLVFDEKKENRVFDKKDRQKRFFKKKKIAKRLGFWNSIKYIFKEKLHF